jgi:hypothetical protein
MPASRHIDTVITVKSTRAVSSLCSISALTATYRDGDARENRTPPARRGDPPSQRSAQETEAPPNRESPRLPRTSHGSGRKPSHVPNATRRAAPALYVMCPVCDKPPRHRCAGGTFHPERHERAADLYRSPAPCKDAGRKDSVAPSPERSTLPEIKWRFTP